MANNQVVPSSSSSFTNDPYTYDVFLSFRGKDTRYNFTDHLYRALCEKGIHTFRDDDELPRGEELSASLVKAIQGSRMSLIVFSENYAESKWCLDELAKILECRESNQQKVCPIFYKVDPSDVRNHKGSFREALAQHDCKFEDNIEKVNRWRDALSDAGKLGGWHFVDGYESQFIHKIVKEISVEMFRHTYLDVATYPVGLESRVRYVVESLDVGGNSVRMVGIWGSGGIGKTTIAKAVYNLIAHRFDRSCFLPNVRETSMPAHGGLVKAQKTLLMDILGDKNLKVTSVDEGVEVIKKMLRNKRVLLILDDVNQLEQLEKLARGVDWFGKGSRIIITTRDKHLLRQVDLIYEVKVLDDHKALKLLCWNAFQTDGPPNDYVELARRAVHYVQGLPLALIVLGSHLCGRSVDQWEAILDSCKRVPNKQIHEILKISFDALEYSEKELFLDIACFFKGYEVDHLRQILESCDLNPAIGIELLVEKALISIEKDGKVCMHDLLEEMGKKIVRQESSEPGKRSRLWLYEDVYRVLKENTGTDTIRGIIVDDDNDICLNSKSFSEMKNLKFLSIYSDHFFGDIDYLSNELRLLIWYGRSLQSFPSSFHPKKLVEFNMRQSSMVRLPVGFKGFPSLTRLDFEECEFLQKIPDLTQFPNLEVLNLDYCTSLVEVHDSVGSLDKLFSLSLKDCSKLLKLPRTLSLKSLVWFDLGGCGRLENFPEIVGKMESLRYLDLRGTAIKELHSSIAYLIKLEKLILNNCEDLITLPSSIYELQHLTLLGLRGCPKLVPLLNEVNSEVSLGTAKSLALLLPTNPNTSDDNRGSLALPRVEKLSISKCNSFCWPSLQRLDLSRNNFDRLPVCFSKFVNLEHLDLSCCERLREIPELPPKLGWLDLHCCKRLREIPELPPKLGWLDVSDCESLERFPKLSRVLELKESLGIKWMDLCNCRTLCQNLGYDVANALLKQASSGQNSGFDVVLPGDEVPKWFTCRCEQKVSEYLFQLPGSVQLENTGLAFCAVFEGLHHFSLPYDYGYQIFIDDVCIYSEFLNKFLTIKNSYGLCLRNNLWLKYTPLTSEMKQQWERHNKFRPQKLERHWFKIQCLRTNRGLATVKSWGFHLVCDQDDINYTVSHQQQSLQYTQQKASVLMEIDDTNIEHHQEEPLRTLELLGESSKSTSPHILPQQKDKVLMETGDTNIDHHQEHPLLTLSLEPMNPRKRKHIEVEEPMNHQKQKPAEEQSSTSTSPMTEQLHLSLWPTSG